MIVRPTDTDESPFGGTQFLPENYAESIRIAELAAACRRLGLPRVLALVADHEAAAVVPDAVCAAADPWGHETGFPVD